MGGDEFLIVLADLNDDNIAMMISEKILRAVCQPIKLPKCTVSITASIGIAIYPKHGSTSDKLILAADFAMYEAKNRGKNQVSLAVLSNTMQKGNFE